MKVGGIRKVKIERKSGEVQPQPRRGNESERRGRRIKAERRTSNCMVGRDGAYAMYPQKRNGATCYGRNVV